MMTTSATDTDARRAPALRGQTLVVIGGSSGMRFETAPRTRRGGAPLAELDHERTHRGRPDPGQPDRGRLRRHALSASLLGDDLEARRAQLRATLPIGMLAREGGHVVNISATIGRVGQVSDVVDAILFLESSAYVTGEVLHIDGGQVAGR
jgi:NAD(P)-dependent dehydrogenase (short-subunit alcohol dehydrogenase family)